MEVGPSAPSERSVNSTSREGAASSLSHCLDILTGCDQLEGPAMSTLLGPCAVKEAMKQSNLFGLLLAVTDGQATEVELEVYCPPFASMGVTPSTLVYAAIPPVAFTVVFALQVKLEVSDAPAI